MRVVIVHNRYRSENLSGENRVVENDIERLRADGVEVYPYIRDSDEIANWTAIGKASLAVRPLVSPSDALAFRRMLRRVRPDIVHLHNPFPIISPWIVRTAKAQRIPLVQTVHNYRHVCVNGIHFRDGHLCTECVGKKFPWPAVQHGCYQGSRARSLPMAAAVTAHRSTWNLVDCFLPVGDAVADNLRELGIPDSRIEVRPNIVDDPGEPASLGEGVLFVGRLSEEKGIRPLLEAWSTLDIAGNHRLSIAGDGDLRDEVEAAALSDPSIRYLGFLSKAELDGEYRRCAIVVGPSLCPEADGLSIVTALSHGRPVVASDLGSMPAILGDDAGWIVAPGGASLSAGLRVAMSDRAEQERRGVAARKRFSETRSSATRSSLFSTYSSVAAAAAARDRNQ
ncbi:glycosyltransferase family 4 protein [Ilumatobacter sp.]|uniref:glycosyltransferase family 4 protein n=1 Tax=Ilumatobacter sp. TaxID=1967498 RepID=UPI0037519856